MKFKKVLSLLLILYYTVIPTFASTEAKLEYNRGMDLYKLGQYDKSIDAFRKAIDLNPAYIDAYYNLGSILEYLGQKEDALTVFKQIIIRKPTDYEAVYKAAYLSKEIGRNDKAKEFLSLIPTNSYINKEVQELAKDLNSDLQTIKYEQATTKQNLNQPKKNGVYDNIMSPTGIASDKNGNLFVAGFSDNIIYKITPNENKIIYLKDKKINGPIGIVLDELGNLYIANYNANNVLKADKNGQLTVFLNDLIKPYGIYCSNGTLFVSSQGSNAVIRVKL